MRLSPALYFLPLVFSTASAQQAAVATPPATPVAQSTGAKPRLATSVNPVKPAKASKPAVLSAQQQALLDEQMRARAQEMRRREQGQEKTIPRLTSELGVFTVMSDDSLRAGAIASRADDIYRHLQQLITLPAKARYMIIIELVGSTHDQPVLHPYQMSVELLGAAPLVRLRIHVGGGINVVELHRAIVRACLYEYALRSVDLEAYDEETGLALPLWLTTGIEQAILWRGGRLDRDLFVQLFRRSDVLSLKNILDLGERTTVDSTTRELFEASCAALMLSLLNQEGGKQAILSMVEDGLSSHDSARKAMQTYFHELGLSDDSLQKWWALELANMASPSLMESMTPLATEASLKEILTYNLTDRTTGQPRQLSLDDVKPLMQEEAWRALIPSIQNKLTHLSLRAFPGYRPIIAEYQRILTLMLTENDADKIAALVKPLIQLRAAYRTASTRARDYLDWYEMTHRGSGNSAASLQQYLRMRELLREHQAPLDTPMNRYLHDIEQLMELDAGEEIPTRMMEAHQLPPHPTSTPTTTSSS